MRDEIHEITLPKLGESVTEGTIGEWLKSVGDTVAFDDPLFMVETDKVASEFPSPEEGVLLEILAEEGDTVPVGEVVARIGPAGSSVGESSNTAAPAPADSKPATPPPASESLHDITLPKLGESVTEGTIGEWLKSVGDTVAFDDPLFMVETDKVASEFPSPEEGTLVEILVKEGETAPVGAVVARIGSANGTPATTAQPQTATPAAAATPAPRPTASPAAGNPKPAPANHNLLLSPVVRRLAAEHGIDLTQVTGSGAGGRVMREDMEAAIAAGTADAKSAAAPTASKPAQQPAAADRTGEGRVVPLSRIRLVTAQRMVESKRIAPHVWTSVEVDLENIAKLRQQHKARFREQNGASLTYLPFIMRAVSDALKSYPAVNSSIDTDNKTMTLHPNVHLGISVDLDEKGLLAPVIRNADTLNVRGLAMAIKSVSEGARNGTLRSDDLQGSTFTLTNPGPLGSYASAPIINQPNVAIMATDGVTRRPTAVGDAIAIHHMCILGFCYDHRAFDGSTAAKFLNEVRHSLQERDWQSELA